MESPTYIWLAVVTGVLVPILGWLVRQSIWRGEVDTTIRGLQHQLDERKEEDEVLQQALTERRQAYDGCREEIRASLAGVQSDLRIVRHDVARLIEKNGLPPSRPGKEE